MEKTILRILCLCRFSHSLGQKRRFGLLPMTSGLPLSTDILRVRPHVAKVPIAAVPNVHSRKAPATWANPQVVLLKH